MNFFHMVIEDLRVDAFVGLYEKEFKSPHTLSIDLSCSYQATIDYNKNDLTQTVCYEHMCQSIREIVRSRHFLFVEEILHELSLFCLKNSKIQSVKIKVSKVGIIDDAKVGIFYEKSR